MLELYRVLTIFALFADIEEHEATCWRSLCENAAARLVQKLRNPSDLSQHMERLCTAAAGLAYADYLMLQAAEHTDEIRVGEIALRQTGDKWEQVQEIRTYFMQQVADLLVSDRFAFVQTGEA